MRHGELRAIPACSSGNAATWITMLLLAVSGHLAWSAGSPGRSRTSRCRSRHCRRPCPRRTQVMNLVESMQRDVARLENRQEQIREELEGFRRQREDYREVIGRQGEHMEATDQRLGRVDDRLLQVERMLGGASSAGPAPGLTSDELAVLGQVLRAPGRRAARAGLGRHPGPGALADRLRRSSTACAPSRSRRRSWPKASAGR